jgi:hypothetical protein
MRPPCVIRLAAACLAAGVLLGCWTRPDSIAGASLLVSAASTQGRGILPGRPVIVTPSDRGGAARLAAAMAARLGATVVSPTGVAVGELEKASLLGLGSGIFDQAHHKSLLALADSLPPSAGRKVFLFSTSGVSRRDLPGLHEEDPHKALRDRLIAKGCEIVGEFNCVGYNDNSFLFLFGGMNKGHPDAGDIAQAQSFADSLLQGGGK